MSRIVDFVGQGKHHSFHVMLAYSSTGECWRGITLMLLHFQISSVVNMIHRVTPSSIH